MIAYLNDNAINTTSATTEGGCTHANSDPSLRWGHNWKGWISHLIIMKPGTASMATYYDNNTAGNCGSLD